MVLLGSPVWGIKRWVGNFFPEGTPSKDFLRLYSRRLSTVEGNASFYAMPSPATMARWRDETPPGFRFCMKFPRRISHELRLRGAADETAAWIEGLRQLGDRAGPSFLQLPPSFAPSDAALLEDYLAALPGDLRFAVEVRHAGWFTPAGEARLDGLLGALGMARVLFDVRGLRAASPSDPVTAATQAQKPNVPLRVGRTAPFVLVRYISHPERAENLPLLGAWAREVAGWMDEGVDVYFIIHHQDDFWVPTLCRDFHELLAAERPLPPLPRWGDGPAQGSLF